MLSLLRKGLTRRLFSTANTSVDKAQSSTLTQAEKQIDTLPVHLRPYDKAKYEIPLKKIKMNTGYALLEIEPFPRARILRISYNLLDQLRKGFPEESIYRIYNEERIKWIMKVTDATEDIEELEDIFGVEVIELFINTLALQVETFEASRVAKIWEIENTTPEEEQQFMKEVMGLGPDPNPLYKKPERTKASFINE